MVNPIVALMAHSRPTEFPQLHTSATLKINTHPPSKRSILHTQPIPNWLLATDYWPLFIIFAPMSKPRLPLLLLALFLLALPACKMAWRAVRYNVPSIQDHRLWPARTIHREGPIYPLVSAPQPSLPPLQDWAFGKWYQPGMDLEDFWKRTGTVAFLVIQDDTIRYEHYRDGYTQETQVNGFSMAKAFLSTLVGIAVHEGYIGSIDQSAGDYLPYCSDSVLCSVKIRHLLQMTSGIHATEAYLNPWATSSKLYYGDHLYKILDKLSLDRSPGQRYRYQNINSQILGMILAEATGRPLSQYLEEKIWRPLGMESDASWSLSEDTDVEKAFCCLNARARDFARFGLLWLHGGKWRGQQIIPEAWLNVPLGGETKEGASIHYQYAWYTSPARDDFYSQGLLGQFTYISPSTRTVIVRLGDNLAFNVPWYEMFRFIAGLETKPQAIPFQPTDLKPFEGTWHFDLSTTGDTAMRGKQVHLKPTKRGLRVKSDFQDIWYATPSSHHHLFNLEYSRYLHLTQDSLGKPTIHWTRRTLSWNLYR